MSLIAVVVVVAPVLARTTPHAAPCFRLRSRRVTALDGFEADAARPRSPVRRRLAASVAAV